MIRKLADIKIISDTYPLCYLRGKETDGIIVVINPSDKDDVVELDFEVKDAKLLYEYNKAVKIDGKKISVPGCSASYIKI